MVTSLNDEFLTLLTRNDDFDESIQEDEELSSYLPSRAVTIGMLGTDDDGAVNGIVVRADVDGVRIYQQGEIRPADMPDTSMHARVSSWDECLKERPKPRYHHFLAMLMRVEGTRIGGDERVFAQHAHIARRLIELAREVVNGRRSVLAPAMLDRSAISGRYVKISAAGQRVDLHVEECGDRSKPPLLILHTAGADSRQAHAIMSDSDVLGRYRVVAFDMPGHGNSECLEHSFGAWTLTTELYIEIIEAVIVTLGLERPILIGASMAGEACLAMAIHDSQLLGGVIACEASEHVPGRTTPWPKEPGVNSMIFTAEWIDGLIGPDAPVEQRQLIRWQYSQGGYGTFSGDIDFYSGDWDARGQLGHIDTDECPVVMLTGEYDYSCTPEMSESTAGQIEGSNYWTMPDLGHFPICENPELFSPHLTKALKIIERKTHG